jgi:4-oxalocrotonate tautomerase family enzyme
VNAILKGKAMPYVNIKVTGGNEAPSAEQKAELIRGVTELLSRVLNKNPETTVVVIDEIDMDNWGIGGKSVTVRRAEARNK